MKYPIKSVSDLIFRSRVPKSWAEVSQLQTMGVSTIINLQSPWFVRQCIYYKKEQFLLQKYGIKVIYIPLHPLKMPSLHQLEEIYQQLSSTQEKTLIHCKYGVDRTGIAIAYWQVKTQAKKMDEAISDMLHHGFHLFWFKSWIPILEKYLTSFLADTSESDATNQP